MLSDGGGSLVARFCEPEEERKCELGRTKCGLSELIRWNLIEFMVCSLSEYCLFGCWTTFENSPLRASPLGRPPHWTNINFIHRCRCCFPSNQLSFLISQSEKLTIFREFIIESQHQLVAESDVDFLFLLFLCFSSIYPETQNLNFYSSCFSVCHSKCFPYLFAFCGRAKSKGWLE